MSSQSRSEIKVLDHGHASPPPGSVPNSSIPLSFFDVMYLFMRPMERLFFYEFPHSTLYFTQTVLPSLRSSLSQALKTFYPFAGKLICPPSPQKPHIIYVDGDCVVPFTVAESSADFGQIIADFTPRDVKEIYPFVPQLPPAQVLDDTRVRPMLAIQVTVFPNSGICVGVTFHHVAADGRSVNHFMKAWASISRSGGNSETFLTPVLDRNLIREKDSRGLESTFLNHWWNHVSNLKQDKVSTYIPKQLRATFVITRGDIERLKRHVLNQSMNQSEPLRASTFVVTCAFVWTCWTKARELRGDEKQEDNEFRHLCFIADCRNRSELGIPETYFGNCLSTCFVRMKRSELVGENGVVAATKAIGNRVWEFENGILKDAENWFTKFKEIVATGHLMTIAGSPKMRAYDTDFGWGKPKRTEVVHVYVAQAIHVGDCRDEEGGVEIGLALNMEEMVSFKNFFEQSLKAI